MIQKITKLVYDKPHNYLFVNVYHQRLFKNFDEILKKILDPENKDDQIMFIDFYFSNDLLI